MADTDDTTYGVELVLLGIGGAFDADRGIANTGGVLRVTDSEGGVQHILIDCGHTCGRQLAKLDLTYQDIDAVIITHAHGDHIDGLEVLGYKSRFLFDKRVPVYAQPQVLDDIWRSLEPKMGWLQIAKGTSVPATMEDYLDPRPCDERVAIAGGRLEVTFYPVEHVAQMAAYGLLIQLFDESGVAGPVIRWSGDTIFLPDSPVFTGFSAARGDLMFHDCLFLPYYDVTVHTHFEQLQGLPSEVREHLVLVHHGRVEDQPEPLDGMTLGQPLQRFVFSH